MDYLLFKTIFRNSFVKLLVDIDCRILHAQQWQWCLCLYHGKSFRMCHNFHWLCPDAISSVGQESCLYVYTIPIPSNTPNLVGWKLVWHWYQPLFRGKREADHVLGILGRGRDHIQIDWLLLSWCLGKSWLTPLAFELWSGWLHQSWHNTPDGGKHPAARLGRSQFLNWKHSDLLPADKDSCKWKQFSEGSIPQQAMGEE